MVILWVVLAAVAGLGFIVIAAILAQRRQPPLELPPGEIMPTTPLQRLARLTLAWGLVLAAAAAAVVLYVGPMEFQESDRIRLLVTGLFLAAIMVLGWFAIRVGGLSRRGDGSLDERDLAIVARAPAGQSGAILVILAVWVIGLTESHRATGLIPSSFLNLIFWSCAVVSLLALPVGVLIGYRRS